MYDMPDEIDVRADGPLRIITLNRPDDLNAVNEGLHSGLARIWDELNRDPSARAAVITGSGRAFSAGGDFNYIKALSEDGELRAKTLADGRDIVLGMVRCRVPVVAAVNGPAVGLGCSLVALSDVVYIAEDAFLSDPHVQVGLGRRRRRSAHVAAAHQLAVGQGVCADGRPHLRRARRSRSVWRTTSSATRWTRRSRAPGASPASRSKPSRAPSECSTSTWNVRSWRCWTMPTPQRTCRCRPTTCETTSPS